MRMGMGMALVRVVITPMPRMTTMMAMIPIRSTITTMILWGGEHEHKIRKAWEMVMV